MLLIFGSRVKETLFTTVLFVCGYCGVRAAQNVVKRSNRLTLFFIPLFPFSTKYVNVCTNCGGQTAVTADQARNSLSWTPEADR